MSYRLSTVGCLLATILVVPGVRAGTFDLAVRGRAPEYAIVRAAEASPSVKYAAEELRDFTERMTGVRLPIVTDEGPLPPKAIVLGSVQAQRARRPLSQCNGQDVRYPSAGCNSALRRTRGFGTICAVRTKEQIKKWLHSSTKASLR